MAMSRRLTTAILVTIVLVAIVWDIVVAVNRTPGDTISELTLSWAHEHPVLPFCIGIVVGHLFWPQYRQRRRRRRSGTELLGA